jgi:hypothetical protein
MVERVGALAGARTIYKRRSMTKTMHIAAMVVGLLAAGASAAGAQTLNPTMDGGPFISVAVGGQPQTRSFSNAGTFPSFGETGQFQVNQNIGRAFVADVSGGYLFGKHLGVGVGVWLARSKSAVAASVAIPDPLFFGRFTNVSLDDEDQKASTIGVNLMLIWTQPISNKLDATISLGPTFTRTSVDVGSVNVAANSQTGTLSFESQSATSAKGGNLGLDLDYRVNEQYSVGVFGRYAGTEVNLPAVEKLKVGGLQVGGIVRYRF